LIDAQRNYAEFGAMEFRFTALGRHPRARSSGPRVAKESEPIDVGWRVVDVSVDKFEPRGVHEEPWPDDRTTLHWWRPTYLRRS
jgi:hypothetical protein